MNSDLDSVLQPQHVFKLNEASNPSLKVPLPINDEIKVLSQILEKMKIHYPDVTSNTFRAYHRKTGRLRSLERYPVTRMASPEQPVDRDRELYA